MSQSLFKHFGEQGNEHGGRLFWSGSLGNVPFRGAHAPTLTEDELQTQVGLSYDFNCDIFDLSDKDQRARYRWVMDRIVNRWFVLHKVERALVAAEKTVIVYLEWSQRYGELSPSARAARSQGYVYSQLPQQQRQPDFEATIPLAGLQAGKDF
jgi:hypothetical protein